MWIPCPYPILCLRRRRACAGGPVWADRFRLLSAQARQPVVSWAATAGAPSLDRDGPGLVTRRPKGWPSPSKLLRSRLLLRLPVFRAPGLQLEGR